MANMVTMASAKPFITTITTTKPRLQITNTSLKDLKTNRPTTTISLPTPSKLIKNLSLMAAPILTLAAPSMTMAAEIEKAKLFEFNATLPIIMLEFLFLMVALDKLYYTPLGEFMDKRDKEIREKLSSVKDVSEEVKQLEDQAAAVLKAARAEISAALNKMRKETQGEVEQLLIDGRRKVEAELQEALSALEKQKEETVKALDSQIAILSDEIVKKVLPAP